MDCSIYETVSGHTSLVSRTCDCDGAVVPDGQEPSAGCNCNYNSYNRCVGKTFSEAIENIDPKPLEGLQSAGASWVQRVRFAVLPQVLPLFFSYALLRLEINVRASTILGFVGAGGIGEALNTVIQWRHGDQVMAIMVLLVATIIVLDYLSGWMRGKIIGSAR